MRHEREWLASAAEDNARPSDSSWKVAAGFALTLLVVPGAFWLVWRESRMAIDAAFLGLTALASAGLCVAYTLVMCYMRQRDETRAELRRQRRGAEEADRLRNEFIARVSYDIRGPLTAILGYCDLPPERAPSAQERLAAIRRSATGIADAVNDILRLPREAGGAADLRPPTIRAAAQDAAAAPTAERPCRGRVLLAEDSPDLCQVIGFYLQQAGAEVTVVNDGRMACDQVMAAWTRGQPFDLILMDMQMPAGDGRAATMRMRDARYTLPIVALTANVTEKSREECLAAGCNGFLGKPVDQGEFLAVLGRYLHGAGVAASAQVPADLSAHPQFIALRELFRVEIPSRVSEIASALSAGNFATLANLAHRLKGTAGCYGLIAIGEAAAALQAAAEHPQEPEIVRIRLEALQAECGNVAGVKAA